MDLYWIHDGDCSLVSGASPVQRCLQAGDKETGITVRITINWGWGSNHHGQAWGFANQPNFGIYRIMKHILYIYICSIGIPTGEKVKIISNGLGQCMSKPGHSRWSGHFCIQT
jgi:hypothetical protein